MPWGLKRFQQAREVHFLTFSCYRRNANFDNETSRAVFVSALERVRRDYQLCVYAYVVMPEHVHLLINEPERNTLAQAIKSLKQGVARRLSLRAEDPFWQARYYDFNVWSERKFVEKVRYIHRNPVKRGLVPRPEDWPWGSFRDYATGEVGMVEIESRWAARRREQQGIFPTLKLLHAGRNPRPSRAWTGHPQELEWLARLGQPPKDSQGRTVVGGGATVGSGWGSGSRTSVNVTNTEITPLFGRNCTCQQAMFEEGSGGR